MKTGKAMIESVAVFCPACHEAYDGTPDGSQMILNDSGLVGGQIVECPACGTSYRLPAIVSQVGR